MQSFVQGGRTQRRRTFPVQPVDTGPRKAWTTKIEGGARNNDASEPLARAGAAGSRPAALVIGQCIGEGD